MIPVLRQFEFGFYAGHIGRQTSHATLFRIAVFRGTKLRRIRVQLTTNGTLCHDLCGALR